MSQPRFRIVGAIDDIWRYAQGSRLISYIDDAIKSR